MTTRSRGSYRRGVEWIALNDEPEELDVEEVAGYISTLLLAAVFEKDAADVAAAVVRFRKREGVEPDGYRYLGGGNWGSSSR